MLEERPTRPAIPVVDVSTPAAEMKPTPLPRARASERPTDDAVGPSTPRPNLALDAIPIIVASAATIRSLPIGPREAFLLTHVDGGSDLRTLVDVTGMSGLEVSTVVEKLIDLGVVELA